MVCIEEEGAGRVYVSSAIETKEIGGNIIVFAW
jgi:hypothetical protein